MKEALGVKPSGRKHKDGKHTEEALNKDHLIRMKHPRLMALLIILHGLTGVEVLALTILLTLAIGIFADIRWMIVSMMVLFMVVPLLMAYLYAYQGLKPMTALNVVPHMLTISDDGLTIEIPPHTDPALHDDQTDEKGNPTIIFYPYSGFEKYTLGTSGFILISANREQGFLWVPYSIFQDEKESGDFIELLRKGMNSV